MTDVDIFEKGLNTYRHIFGPLKLFKEGKEILITLPLYKPRACSRNWSTTTASFTLSTSTSIPENTCKTLAKE
jgi:hypothetical protein